MNQIIATFGVFAMQHPCCQHSGLLNIYIEKAQLSMSGYLGQLHRCFLSDPLCLSVASLQLRP